MDAMQYNRDDDDEEDFHEDLDVDFAAYNMCSELVIKYPYFQ